MRSPTATGALDDAVEAFGAGELDVAESRLLQVLRADAGNATARFLLGKIRADRGEHERALPDLEAAAAAAPGNADVLTSYGISLRALDRCEEALEAFSHAAAVAPDNPAIHYDLGWALEGLGRQDEAIAAHRRSLRLDPDFWLAHMHLGTLLEGQGRLRAATAELRCAYSTCPDARRLAVLPSWSTNLMLLDRVDEALSLVDDYLAHNPRSGSAWHNRGIVLYQCGRHREALESLERAMRCPGNDNTATLASMAFPFWAAGEIEAGHAAFEHGFAAGTRTPSRVFQVPMWDGAPLDGQRLIVWHEQGVGDDILFASCYPDLVELAAHLVIECDSRLVPLFARSFPQATVRPQLSTDAFAITLAEDDFDLHCPQATVPRYLRPSIDSFPARPSYLVPDPGRKAFWRDRLDSSASESLRVGISWRSMLMTRERRLHYTRLDEWGAVLTTPGTSFVNLQYDDCLQEVAVAERRLGVPILGWDDLDLMNDFDETAALVANLDLVIAPSNTVGKLAGALGVPVFELLAYDNPYSYGLDSLPWLPTLRIFGRRWDESWDSVLERVAAALRQATEKPIARIRR